MCLSGQCCTSVCLREAWGIERDLGGRDKWPLRVQCPFNVISGNITHTVGRRLLYKVPYSKKVFIFRIGGTSGINPQRFCTLGNTRIFRQKVEDILKYIMEIFKKNSTLNCTSLTYYKPLSNSTFTLKMPND